jgi:O-antigen ligase
MGFLGLVLFLLFVFSVLFNFVKKTRLKSISSFSFFVLILVFLVMALFDHLFWTLQQGSLIFWASLAMLETRFLVLT